MTIEISMIDIICRIIAGICGILCIILYFYDRHKTAKWLKENAKAELLESFGLETKYCKDCEHWTVEDKRDDYGNCEFRTGYLMHRCENCDKWKKRKEPQNDNRDT